MPWVHAPIDPIETERPLRDVLAENFPGDGCAELPIAGGWGYTKESAVRFVAEAFPIPGVFDFVP
jgi:hypothetical protein